MISIEYLIYTFLLLIVGMFLTLYVIKAIFETSKVERFLGFFAFSMGMLGLIPFLISDLSINKMLLDGFLFFGFLYLGIVFYIERRRGGK